MCPLCEYSLYLRTEPRCPECGYTFSWPDVLDETRRIHRYLFEHHPDRNWWSFWKTAASGLLPRKFWGNLHPVQPSKLKRLLLYWGLITTVVLISFSLQCVPALRNVNLQMLQFRTIVQTRPPPRGYDFWVDKIVTEHGSAEAAMDAECPIAPSPQFFLAAFAGHRFLATFGRLLLCYLLWPWLTFLALLVFAWSMARARVNRVHVLRCVLYSYDVGLWVGLLLVAATAATFVSTSSVALSNAMELGIGLFCGIMAIHMTYRLWIAYRKYLDFNHALSTVVASQVIVSLCMLWIILNLPQ